MGVMILENWQPAAPADDPRWGFAAIDQDGLPRKVAGAFSQSRCEAFWNCATPGVGYYTAARPDSAGSKALVAGPAEFSPSQHWRFSELGADWSQSGDTVTIQFRGTGLALRVRRAADRANFYISIDGQPANALPRDSRGAFLQLIPPDVEHASVDMIPVAAGLPYGLHTAEITAERGWNQWSLVGWSVQAQAPAARQYQLSLAGLLVLSVLIAVGGALAARRVAWGALGSAAGISARLSDVVHWALMAAATLVFYLSAWMTWGQQIPSAFRRLDEGTSIVAMLGLSALFYYSPWLFVTLLSGLALFVLILLRLDLGLALVALVIPFYMLPRSLYERVFSMAEIVMVMCFIAWLIHQLAGPGRIPKISNLRRSAGCGLQLTGRRWHSSPSPSPRCSSQNTPNMRCASFASSSWSRQCST